LNDVAPMLGMRRISKSVRQRTSPTVTVLRSRARKRLRPARYQGGSLSFDAWRPQGRVFQGILNAAAADSFTDPECRITISSSGSANPAMDVAAGCGS
jgi:hypothetical protein